MDSIKVTKTCGRCGHKSEREVTLEEVRELEQHRQDRKETSAKLQEVADSLHEMKEPPQLIVYSLNPETGTYSYNALYDLCDRGGNGEGGRRGCLARVQDLLKDLFNVKDTTTGEKKERKPRTRKPKVEGINALTPETQEEVTEQEAEA